jgi:hypothetical protein
LLPFEKVFLIYSREQDCQTHFTVQVAIEDIILAAQLNSSMAMTQKYFISVAADMWTVHKKDGGPLCVVEIVRSRTDMQKPYQMRGIFRRMKALRNHFRMKGMFGIITCYEWWQIVWLPESDVIATSKEEVAQEASNSTEATEDNRVYGTELLSYSDKMLPRMLVSLFRKLSHLKEG